MDFQLNYSVMKLFQPTTGFTLQLTLTATGLSGTTMFFDGQVTPVKQLPCGQEDIFQLSSTTYYSHRATFHDS
jgi:hypothetical protein